MSEDLDFSVGFEQEMNSCSLFAKRVASRAQSEFQRLAWNLLNEGLDDPVEAVRNGPRKRHRFNLHVETAIALLVGRVAILPPQEAVLLFCRKGMLVDCAGRFYL